MGRSRCMAKVATLVLGVVVERCWSFVTVSWLFVTVSRAVPTRPCTATQQLSLMHSVVGHIVVGFVLSLICFIAYSSQIFIIWPWYGSVLSVELITLLFPFKYVFVTYATAIANFVLDSILVGLLLWNYYLCVVTDPGQVPEFWVSLPSSDAAGHPSNLLPETRYYLGRVRSKETDRWAAVLSDVREIQTTKSTSLQAM